MSRTLLQLIQQATAEIGIPQPQQIVGATDEQSIQLLSLAIREGKEFSALANSYGGWQNLHEQYVFFTEVDAATTGDITNGSRVITNIPSTAGLVANTWFVDGTGLPIKAVIVSVDSGTQVTIDRPCTETTTGVSLTFAKGGYDLPSDFAYFTQLTYWDGSYRWQLLGPISAQEKQVLKYGISPTGPRRRFYIRKNKMFLDPIPYTDGETLAYDYYSNAWCESAAGVGQQYWQADTDIYKLDEDCFVMGLKWRYLRAKGLDYTQEYADYENESVRVMGRDGGNRDLPLNARSSTEIQLLSDNQIPDTGFGS